jgi:hypothetical protein
MTEMEDLKRERDEVLGELAALGEMRRGSVVGQYMERKRKDGSVSRRGPYFLYSYKKKGRTISRRLAGPEQASLYRAQIQAFRRFQELTTRLVEIGQQISEFALEGKEVKKTSRRRLRSKKTRR